MICRETIALAAREESEGVRGERMGGANELVEYVSQEIELQAVTSWYPKAARGCSRRWPSGHEAVHPETRQSVVQAKLEDDLNAADTLLDEYSGGQPFGSRDALGAAFHHLLATLECLGLLAAEIN
jgi:hypothetical protein